MDFWNTVKGQRLADVLIQYMPSIKAKKTKQYGTYVDFYDLGNLIESEIADGAKVVSTTQFMAEVYVVFEKEES